MKSIIAFFFAIILLTGCSKKSEEPKVNDATKYQVDTTDVKTIPVDNPNESFNLDYKLAVGKTYHYRLTNTTSEIQTITTDSTIQSNVKQTIVTLIDLSPASVDKDGVIEINCMITGVKLNANANGNEFSYESGVTKDSIEINKFAEYESLINSELGIRITKNGEILEIFRTDKILDKYLRIKGLADSINAQQRDQLKKNMVIGALNPLFYQVFRKMPEKQMAKDSTWFYKQPAAKMMVFDVQNTNTYRILNVEKYGDSKLAVIEGGMETKITGNNKTTQQGVTYNFSKPETNAGGKIYFNVTDGCIQKSKTYTNAKINYSMVAKTPQGTQKGVKTEDIRNSYLLERL